MIGHMISHMTCKEGHTPTYLEAEVEAGVHGTLVGCVVVARVQHTVHAQVVHHLVSRLHQTLGQLTCCILDTHTHTHTHTKKKKR